MEIGWADGRVAVIDLKPLIEARAALAPLRDAKEFARVAISADGWALEWPCGIEFGAPQLRRWADAQGTELVPQSLVERLRTLPSPPSIETRDEECLPERAGS